MDIDTRKVIKFSTTIFILKCSYCYSEKINKIIKDFNQAVKMPIIMALIPYYYN